jgi:hypothetical protein
MLRPDTFFGAVFWLCVAIIAIWYVTRFYGFH